VKPEGQINDTIASLTGITNEKVVFADKIDAVDRIFLIH